VISDPIEAEYRSLVHKRKIARLLVRKGVTPEALALAIDGFCAIAERVVPTGEPPACRDEKDRKYLHCTVAARVDYLVSHDLDLLELKQVEGIPILTPAEVVPRLP
jgi:putative PIN family toxin of toxin-antitoxin system